MKGFTALQLLLFVNLNMLERIVGRNRVRDGPLAMTTSLYTDLEVALLHEVKKEVIRLDRCIKSDLQNAIL